jgi:hypothetical protein
MNCVNKIKNVVEVQMKFDSPELKKIEHKLPKHWYKDPYGN